jgi:hypothetical protein
MPECFSPDHAALQAGVHGDQFGFPDQIHRP